MIVATTAELLAALANPMQARVAIGLAAGVYEGVHLKGLPHVSLSAADAANPPTLIGATFTSIASGSLKDMIFKPIGAGTACALIGCQNFDVVFNKFTSDAAAHEATSSGLGVYGCTGVDIVHNDFGFQAHGALVNTSSKVTIEANHFHDLRTHGMDIATTDFISIVGNTFADFYPINAPAPIGDHPDAIIFSTLGASRSATGITITDNIITRGKGSPVQGIFLKDNSGTRFPFLNLIICHNLLIGTGLNGIAVADATAPQVIDNQIWSYPPHAEISWMHLVNCAGAATSGNQALVGGDVLNTPVSDQGAAALAAWKAAPP